MLLIVDDDPKLRRTIRQGLEENGIPAETVGSAEEAMATIGARSTSFDLILLDVMMPGISGWEFLANLREQGNQTPVMFLTARHSVEERVRGLRLGAEDYIVKPFAFSELLARIEVMRRRVSNSNEIVLGDLRINPARRWVELDGQRIDVTPRELDLLTVLATSPGRIFDRKELLRIVWDIDFDPGTNVVNVQIARLRRKLGRNSPSMIETVVGRGYRIVESPGSVEP